MSNSPGSNLITELLCPLFLMFVLFLRRLPAPHFQCKCGIKLVQSKKSLIHHNLLFYDWIRFSTKSGQIRGTTQRSESKGFECINLLLMSCCCRRDNCGCFYTPRGLLLRAGEMNIKTHSDCTCPRSLLAFQLCGESWGWNQMESDTTWTWNWIEISEPSVMCECVWKNS